MIEKLKQYIENQGFVFIYDTSYNLNQRICEDGVNFPLCYCVAVNDGLIFDGVEQINLTLFFCDRGSFDFNEELNEQILQRLKNSGFEVIKSIREGNDFEIIGTLATKRIRFEFDQWFLAYGFGLTIRETVGICL